MESITTPRPPARPDSGSVTRRLLLIGGMVAIAGLLALGFLPKMKQHAELAAEAQQVRSDAVLVSVVQPHMAGADDLILPGGVEAIEQTTINARTSGYLRHRYVDIGSRVRAGELLAEVQSPEVDQQLVQAKADTAQAVAGAGQARADVTNKQAGVAQTQADVMRLQASVEQARAALSHAKAQLQQSRSAERSAEARAVQSQQTLGQRNADLEQANTQLSLADKTEARYLNLLKQGFVAQQDYDVEKANLDTRRSALTSAKAAVSAAQADVDAAQQAVASSKSDIDAAQSDVRAAEQNVSAAQAAVASGRAGIAAARANVEASRANVAASVAAVGSKQANVEHFAVLRSFERVVAPFSGVITARNVDDGALINAGAATSDTSTTPRTGLFGLARTDVLRILVNVPQSYVTAIRPGMPAEVLIREMPGRKFIGTVYRTSGALDASTRTLLTEVHLDNRGGQVLPGMYANVRFAAPQSHPSLRVPANTLVINADGTRVAYVDPDNRLHYVPVQIGRDYGTEVEIVSGLKGDEKLVSGPGDDLKEGMTVKPVAAPVPPAH
jgi:RND family efflux transporter MFP subunit